MSKMAAQRLDSIVSQMQPEQGRVNAIKNHDDIVITVAVRTAITKGYKGVFKDTALESLIYKTLEQVRQRSNIDPAFVEDICLGNVRDGRASTKLRAGALRAGFPHTTNSSSVNRFCASGLKAIQDISNQIRAGEIQIGIAIGAENMTQGGKYLDETLALDVLTNPEAADVMLPMIQTSEILSNEFKISRLQQDEYAVESFRRAEVSQKNGWFADEIVPITCTARDPETGRIQNITVTKDEGLRYGTTLEELSRVRPAAPELGDKTTGGNASQISDGGTYLDIIVAIYLLMRVTPLAAAVLLMKRSRASELGLPVLAKFCGAAVAGVPPRVMGAGPVYAIPKLLGKFNLDKDDIDIFEINEAFASMSVYCLRELGLHHSKVNPRGGAIALTPRQTGTGQGMAGLFVNEQL
ncbi:acetyl-CoA acyltransferase [Ilyonectria robusta]